MSASRQRFLSMGRGGSMMIPGEGDELPEGSDPSMVRRIREMASRSPTKEAGMAFLMESDERGVVRVGTRAWESSPLFVILDYFGMPFNSTSYHEVIDSLVPNSIGDECFTAPERTFVEGTALKAVIVRTVEGWSGEDARKFVDGLKD